MAIDFGTTATAGAAIDDRGASVVEIDNRPRMTSMLFWKDGADAAPGRLLVGDAAENEALLQPDHVVRCPKYKIGQPFMLVGNERIPVADAISSIFEYVVGAAAPRMGGIEPRELRLTHPARWGEGRLGRLREAASKIGFDDPLLIPEPEAAAIYFATEELSPGDCVAVYDLGGGTFDTAVLRRTADGFELVGSPGGRDDLGGEDFDERLYRYLGNRLDAEQWHLLTAADAEPFWRQRLYAFKNDVRRAKERLSKQPDATVLAPVPGQSDMRVTTEEFEALIRDDIVRTVEELRRTIEQSGQSVDGLAAIYLAGGSSQIPLVSRLVEERLGKRPTMLGDPKAVTALGAAAARQARVSNGGGVVVPPPEPPPVDEPPPPPPPVPPPPPEPDAVDGKPGPEPNVSAHFKFALISILLFFPTGIPAVVYASRTRTYVAQRDWPAARRAGKIALRWCVTSLVIFLLWVALIAIGAASSTSNSGSGSGSGSGAISSRVVST